MQFSNGSEVDRSAHLGAETLVESIRTVRHFADSKVIATLRRRGILIWIVTEAGGAFLAMFTTLEGVSSRHLRLAFILLLQGQYRVVGADGDGILGGIHDSLDRGSVAEPLRQHPVSSLTVHGSDHGLGWRLQRSPRGALL